jgi:hypothetical protein
MLKDSFDECIGGEGRHGKLEAAITAGALVAAWLRAALANAAASCRVRTLIPTVGSITEERLDFGLRQQSLGSFGERADGRV